ncbi:sensor histidine kinase, partial [Klebsiella pneumoniae]|uniref:sensor histidine kinase n=1 Tax=Klebsiella pneumoniae TaxID=573 RepID=UPI00201013CD
FRFFRRKISRPIQVLMEGAERIHRGELGCRIDAGRDSREFVYLTESFNQMSGQLRHQFDRLYQEELARRDAQINPHFLNNTLETINWQARMSGD